VREIAIARKEKIAIIPSTNVRERSPCHQWDEKPRSPLQESHLTWKQGNIARRKMEKKAAKEINNSTLISQSVRFSGGGGGGH